MRGAISKKEIVYLTKSDTINRTIYERKIDDLDADPAFVLIPMNFAEYDNGKVYIQKTYTKKGKTVSYCMIFENNRYKDQVNYFPRGNFLANVDDIAWSMVYGESAIIINWQRPVDRKTLSTLLSVNIA